MSSLAVRYAMGTFHKRRPLAEVMASAATGFPLLQLRCSSRRFLNSTLCAVVTRKRSTFDMPTSNQVARGRGRDGGSGKSDTASMAWHLGGAFTRFDRRIEGGVLGYLRSMHYTHNPPPDVWRSVRHGRFDVFEVNKAGGIRRTSVSLGDVMAEFGVHARDLLSLGLQDERYNPPPAVLPRHGVVVIALGPFKALVHTEACLVFEAGRVDVAHIAPILAELMRANSKPPPSEGRQESPPLAPVSSQADVAGAQLLESEPGSDETAAADSRKKPSTSTSTVDATGKAWSKTTAADVCELGQTGLKSAHRPPNATGGRKSDIPAAADVRTPPARSDGDPERPLRAVGIESDDSVEEVALPPAGTEKGVAMMMLSTTPGETGEDNFSPPAPEDTQSFTVDQEYARVLSAVDAPLCTADRLKLTFGVGANEEGASGMEADEEGAYGQESGEAEGNGERRSEHPMKTMFTEQTPMPFELAMLEAMFQEVCAGYHRRAHVVRRLMERGLTPGDTSSIFTPSRIDYYRVVPLKLALKQLELKLSQTRACLEELMHSDEDMLGLLLTEAKQLGEGQMLDAHRHSVVELLLEYYHRQLVLVGHDVAAMREEMESMQELAAISLDVSRNSMIAVDIRLAMVNVGIACAACVFGAMGMNVANGLEEVHLAFLGVVGGSAVLSAAALAGVMRHLRSVARSGDSQQVQLMALNSICDHVDDIESVLRTELEQSTMIDDDHAGAGAGGEYERAIEGTKTSKESPPARGKRQKPPRAVIDRHAMARKLSRARGTEISKQELDLIFAIFDTTGDGSIDTNEYGRLVPESAGSLRKGVLQRTNDTTPPTETPTGVDRKGKGGGRGR